VKRFPAVISMVYETIMTFPDAARPGAQDDVTDLINRLRRTEALLERAADGQSIDLPTDRTDSSDSRDPVDPRGLEETPSSTE
jgi:hypothetical protein